MTIDEKIEYLLELKKGGVKQKSSRNLYFVLSLLLIISGVFATYRLTGIPQTFTSLAGASSTPTNIKVVDVKTNGFTITWKTQAETTGYIKYGTAADKKDKIAFDDNAIESDRKTYTAQDHQITVSGISPDQLLFYSVVSKGKEYAASEGSIFTPIKTLPEGETIEGNTTSSVESGFGDLIEK